MQRCNVLVEEDSVTKSSMLHVMKIHPFGNLLSFCALYVLFRGIRSDFESLFHFSMKFLCANSIAPNGTPQNGAILFAYIPQTGALYALNRTCVANSKL